MNPNSFREYDIRGVADVDLPDDVVRALGLAIGERACGGDVVVGRDCRLTSPRLFAALTDGIRAHASVIDIGVEPTPAFVEQEMLAQFGAVAAGVPDGPDREQRLRAMLEAALHEFDDR